MARRILGTIRLAPPGYADYAIDSVTEELTAYLDYGRRAFLELDMRVRPECDLVLDECSSVDDLARRIVEAITLEQLEPGPRSPAP